MFMRIQVKRLKSYEIFLNVECGVLKLNPPPRVRSPPPLAREAFMSQALFDLSTKVDKEGQG
jgi:hypothetical protein